MVSCFKHGSKKNGFSVKQGQGLKGSVTNPKLHFKPPSSAISYGNVRKFWLRFTVFYVRKRVRIVTKQGQLRVVKDSMPCAEITKYNMLLVCYFTDYSLEPFDKI